MKLNFTKQKTNMMLFALLFVMTAFTGSLSAQLTGTKNIPGDYATLALAITDLNTQGVGPGGVVINLIGGNPETAPAGGYSITASGTAGNPIIIQGNANVITASGSLTAGALNDAIFKIIGGDYITLAGFNMQENATNTVTTAGSNNMTEFGVALFYATVTDGAQNVTIQTNTITLNRTYQNTFGIYSNSMHTATAMTTAASATGATGGNHNLHIYSNNISNVNLGMVVVGPTAAADQNQGLDIGGGSLATANTLSNFGTTGTFSSYSNVSGTGNGILIKNIGNFNISYNSIASSNGGTTAGTLNGIQIATYSSAPTVAYSQVISNNNISLRSGVAGGAMNGINVAATAVAATSSLTISNNDFNTFGHTVAGTAAINLITNAEQAGVTNIINNTFSNITVNTTGSFVFISNSVTRPANAVCNVNNNSIVGSFNKTGAGGTVTFYTSNGSTPTTGTENNLNNNFSNITVTGATTIAGWASTDGSTTNPFGPAKNVSNNIFNNITGGTSGVTLLNVAYGNAGGTGNSVSNNTITGISSGGAITGFISAGGNQNIFQNSINGLSTTGGSLVFGININGGNIQNVYKNKIYDLSSSVVGGGAFIAGIQSSSGTTNNIYNNIIGDLRAPNATGTNQLVGLQLVGGTTVNVYYNSVYLNATTTNTVLGSSALNATTGPGTINLRNNILVNNSTPSGIGIAVAFRTASSALTNYGAASNNNLFYAGTPSPTTAIFYDGTTVQQTLAAYKAFVGPTRDAASVTENPLFASTVAANANFLHFNASTTSLAESNAVNVATYTDDFDGDVRQGNAGYAGTGTAPDIGADEFAGVGINPPVVNSVSITPTGSQCTAVSRNVTATVTPGSTSLNSVVLNYSFNGVAQTPITMTGGNLATTSTWNATIPVGVPSNANVTWNITVSDATYTLVTAGTSYKDEPLAGLTASVIASANPICEGNSVNLSTAISHTSAAATYTAPPAVTNPTVDEDLGNITFGPINNTSAINSLVGTIGTASGVAGSYSNYTAFGPYNFTAGNTYTLSLSSLQQATAYGNAFGVYIDYNRNGLFTDAGEAVYVSGSTTLGAHTETASIVIPATAAYGKTRLRVVSNEGLVTGPSMTVGYGEYEEYMLNIIPSFTAYAWSDGSTTVSTSSTTIQSPTVNTTYSFIATAANGCTISSAMKTITVTPLPSSPIASNSSQCGLGVPTASVSGGTSYNWYATPTSTTVLQSGASANFTTSISSTTTWYVTSVTGACESSTRTAVTQTVSIPDAVTANTSASNLCVGGANTVTLTAVQTGTNGNVYSFSWNASPVSGSGMPTTVTGSMVTVTPTLPGTYNYTVTATDGVCTTVSSVAVSLNNLPSIIASSNPTVVCSGGNVMLTANTVGTGFMTLGSGALVTTNSGNSSGNYVSPFSHYYGGYKAQYIIRASELQAAGLSAGNITSLAFDVTTAGISYSSYAISMAATTASVATTTFDGSVSQVYTAASVTPTVGLNTYNFATPFNWNGTSNIVIQICWSNNNGGGTAAEVKYDSTPFASMAYYRADNATPAAICGSGTATGVISNRPLMRLGGQVYSTGGSSHAWQWNPGAINSNTASVNPVNGGTTAVTQTYTATVTNTVTGCSNSTSVGVLVNPLPSSPVVSDASQCGIGVPTASVSGGTSYNWYATPTSTTVLQSGSSTNFTTSISSTTTWYVSSFNGTCESPRVALTQTVNTPPALTLNAPSAICPVTGIGTFSITSTVSDYQSYIWSPGANLYTDAAATTPYSGGNATVLYVKSNSVGNINVMVSATNTLTGCANTSSTSITINAGPTAINVTATPTLACSGSSVALSVTTPSVLLMENFNAATNNWTKINNSTGGTPANAAWTLRTSPYTSNVGTGMTSNDASQFYLTDSDAQGSGSTANTILQSPAINTNGLTSLTLSFFHYYNYYNASDAAKIEVSTNGTSWTQVQNYATGAVDIGTPTAFATATVNLDAYVGNTTLYVRYNYSAAWGYGWAIDNVSISGGTPLAYSWTSSPAGFTSSVQSPTLIATTTSTYNATITNTVTGCALSGTTSIVVNPTPTVSAVSSSSAICSGNSATLTASGATNYTWSPVGGTASTAVVTPTSNVTYTVTGQSSGCSSTATVNLVVNTTPTVTASASSTVICSGGANTVTLTAVSSNSTYAWAPTGGTTSTEVVSPSSNAVYTVTSNNAGCTATATVAVAVNTTPTVTAAASASTICSGTTVTLTASGAPNYTWSPIGVTNSTAVVTPTANATYTVTGESAGCSSTATVSLVVNTTPTVSASASSTVICSGGANTVTLTAVSSNSTYAWAPTGGTTSTEVVSPSSNAVYTVTSNNAGCTATATIAVSVNTTPTVTAVASSTAFCSGNTATLTASGANNYTWSPSGDLTAVSVVTPTSSVTYTVTGESLGCSAMATVNLNVTQTPTVTASASPTAICAGNSATLVAVSSTNDYTWTPAGGTADVAIVSPASNTTYTVTSTNGSCVGTATVDLVVLNTPSISVSPLNATACSGSTVALTASGADTYTWSSGGGNAATAVFSPTAASTYTVDGSNMCGNGTATVNVGIDSPLTLSASTSATMICLGLESATLTVTGTAANYTWTPGGQTTTSIVVSPTITMVYTVTASNACGVVTSTVTQNVQDCTGIEELFAADMNVYPNPAIDVVNFEIPASLAGQVKLEIYDALGKVVALEELTREVTSLRVAKFNAGVYMFKMISNNGDVKIGKLIKQ